MKTLIFSIIFLLLPLGNGPVSATAPSKNIDSPFSVYRGNASQEEERVFLDTFAFYLDENPEMIGYIAYFSSDKQSARKMKNRVARAVKYLSKRKIRVGRLVVLNGGRNEESKIVLQPVHKDTKPPFG